MRALGLVFLALAACVPAPTDPVASGSLCLPATADCPAQTLIRRDAVGRNQLDYAIQNTSTTETTVIAEAYVPAGESDAGTDLGADMDSPILIAKSEHQIAPEGSVGNRWTPQLLGTREEIEFSIACTECEVNADYVLTSVALECSADDDCSSGWLCDTRIPGRCVECMSDDDCQTEQTCNIDRGRCTPANAASCSSGGAGTTGILLFLILFFLPRRKRVAAAILGLTFLSAEAFAAPPIASLGVGVGTQIFTGEIGAVTQPGLSLSIAQELRWQYLGLSLGLCTSYFLTDQPAPPFSRDLRTVSVLLGPRGYLPLGPIELVAAVDYMRLGLDSNSLVRITGPELNFNGMSLSTGIRYRWSGLEARIDAAWQPVFNLPGDVIWLQIGVAVASGS